MKRVFGLLFIGLLIGFIVIQFFPAELPENIADSSYDLMETSEVPENIKTILIKACYDCHSSQTSYPWYSKVAPISWLVAKDVIEGREELNLSNWGEFSKRKKIKMLDDIAEEVEKKNMPLKIYTTMHSEAILTDSEIKSIINWSKSLSNKILGKSSSPTTSSDVLEN